MGERQRRAAGAPRGLHAPARGEPLSPGRPPGAVPACPGAQTPASLLRHSRRCLTRRSCPSVELSSAARACPTAWWCGTMCTWRLRCGGAVAITCGNQKGEVR